MKRSSSWRRPVLAGTLAIGLACTVEADLLVDFGPGAVQADFTAQQATDTTYQDVLYGVVDVRVDATAGSAGFTRAPDVDPVVSFGSQVVADGVSINDLEDDMIFRSGMPGGGVDITISGLVAGHPASFEAWFADTRSGPGAGGIVDQEVFLDGVSQGTVPARFGTPTPSVSLLLVGTGVDIVIRVQEANGFDQLRFNGFALTTGSAPAVVSVHPVDAARILGDTASTQTWFAAATGVAPVSFQWRADGVDLPGETNTTLSLLNAPSAAYDVVASNAYGMDTSRTATVVETLPAINEGSRIVLVGDTVPFSIALPAGPAYTYQWKLQGADISGANSATYTIGDAQPSDGGLYSVEATLDGVTAESDPVNLSVRSDSLPPPSRTSLTYDEPATVWAEAMPIGNGRLGGMVYGDPADETIVLTEDTIWSGGPQDYTNYGASNHLAQLRNLILTEQYDAAADYGAAHSLGDPKSQKGFQNLGRLLLSFPGHDVAQDYERKLEMASGLVQVTYRVGGTTFTREILASNPDQVIAMHLTSDQPSNITFTASFTSPHTGFNVQAAGADGMALLGQADSILFESRVQAIPQGGSMSFNQADGTFSVTDADSVVLLVAAASNYVNYNDVSADQAQCCADYLSGVASTDFAVLKQRHVADFRCLFDRVSIDLGATSNELAQTTDQLLADYQAGQRSSLLEEQLFQFGRYMNISGARPGTQPLNLVGIWAENLNAPWGGKWTLNINAQLNTWPVETTNLPECHKPLLALLEDLRVTGASVAREHYNCRGFVAHHNTDLWRGAAPVDTAIHGLWTTGSAWLCRHIYEHYDFSRDLSYLAGAYPTLKEAAAFYEDFLIEDPDGNLGTCPAISFEQHFQKTDGTTGRLTYSPTMDNQILRDFFNNCIMAAEALGVDADKRAEWAVILSRLRPNQIDPVTGRLMEWAFSAEKPTGSGQTAACWGVSPGRGINIHDTPAIAAAAVDYMNYQIPRMPAYETAGSWVTGTLLNSWARLSRSVEAYGTLQKAIKERLFSNLMMHFYTQQYFEIDGNMGSTAGMTEMLLQSHRLNANKEPIIDLLPTLPAEWPEGSIRGLRARGAFLIDLEWTGGALRSAKITSTKGTPLNLYSAGTSVTIPTEAGKTYLLNAELEVFRILAVEVSPLAGEVNLNVATIPGRPFRVLCTAQLASPSWTGCGDPMTSALTTAQLEVTDFPATADPVFFKLEDVEAVP